MATKAVSGSEEFFLGHFPGAPVMPGVLLLEGLAQAAGIWLLEESGDPSPARSTWSASTTPSSAAPWRPATACSWRCACSNGAAASHRFEGTVRVGDQRVAEATILLQTQSPDVPQSIPAARVARGAVLGPGVRVGPFCIVGPTVRIGRDTVLDSHVVIEGDTTIGVRQPLLSLCLRSASLPRT